MKTNVLMFVLSTFVIVGLTGCMSASFSPETQGVVTGKLLYTTYVKVADTQDAEFKEKVEKLWNLCNTITTADQLNAKYDELNKQFTVILADKGLTEADIKLLTSIANDVLIRVKNTVDDTFAYDSDGIKFLIGVRDGVNSMIQMTTQTK